MAESGVPLAEQRSAVRRGIVVAVEGPWSVGKSLLCERLVSGIPQVVFLPEPNHLSAVPIPANIGAWYLSAWRHRMEQARAACNTGQDVLMERSWFSTMAFAAATDSDLGAGVRGDISYHKANQPDYILVVSVSPGFYGCLDAARVRSYRPSGVYLDDKRFVERFIVSLKAGIVRSNVAWSEVWAGDEQGFRDFNKVVVDARGLIAQLVQVTPPSL